jgi:hypothetical protein
MLLKRLARCGCEMSASASRRDGAIVAWHEVPGKCPSKEPSRRVRYDRALLVPEVFLVEGAFRTDVRRDGRLMDPFLNT